MSLQFTLESLDDVSEEIKPFYQEADDGTYRLAVEGIEDTGALKRAKDYEKEGRKAAEQKARELETQLEEIQSKIKEAETHKARKSGDVEALEKSWADKLTKREQELLGQMDGLKGQLQNVLVDEKARAIAAEISTSPDLLFPHIRARLAADFEGDTAKTRILDGEGKPSALTFDDLKQEFAAREDFQPIIIGSKASGGGAGGGNNGGGAQKLDFSKASRAEKVQYLKQKKGN